MVHLGPALVQLCHKAGVKRITGAAALRAIRVLLCTFPINEVNSVWSLASLGTGGPVCLFPLSLLGLHTRRLLCLCSDFQLCLWLCYAFVGIIIMILILFWSHSLWVCCVWLFVLVNGFMALFCPFFFILLLFFFISLFNWSDNILLKAPMTWGVFHEAGLRESLVYLNKSGSFKRESRSTNVAYLNASWVTMVTYAAEPACSWAGLRSSLAQLRLKECPTGWNRLPKESSTW